MLTNHRKTVCTKVIKQEIPTSKFKGVYRDYLVNIFKNGHLCFPKNNHKPSQKTQNDFFLLFITQKNLTSDQAM